MRCTHRRRSQALAQENGAIEHLDRSLGASEGAESDFTEGCAFGTVRQHVGELARDAVSKGITRAREAAREASQHRTLRRTVTSPARRPVSCDHRPERGGVGQAPAGPRRVCVAANL